MTALRFLEPAEAWARLRAASFWSTVQPAELSIRYGSDVASRDVAWEQLRADGFTPFPPREREYLEAMAKAAVRRWEEVLGIPFPMTRPIPVARWPSAYDWGYPFTVSDTIVIPTELALRLEPDTFLHEVLHLLQRRHPELFRAAYAKQWGFEYVPRGLEVPASVRAVWVSNPDGWDNHHYVVRHPATGRPWCLVCVLDPVRATPVARAIAVDPSVSYLEPERGVLLEAQLREWLGAFSQLYHPHELLAKHLESWLEVPHSLPAAWRQVLLRVAEAEGGV